ncbi:MAG: GNAT family N-acetyltransferase [Deltaproteobacteria bacterium]|nr:GNAT family N-acetyltransferase [Deltaproteobacteria bacterium]
MPQPDQNRREVQLQVGTRAYTDGDYIAVAEILDKAKLVDPERDNRECLARKIERDPGSIFVATTTEGRVIGTVFTVSDGWAAFIFRLAVHPDFRGKVDGPSGKSAGIILMEAAEARLRAQGARDVGITVNDEYVPLKTWYQQQGYKPTGMYRFLWKTL